MKCDEQVEEDESFEPRCDKCPFVKLLQENELSVEIYQSINSEFFVKTGIVPQVLNTYRHDIESSSPREQRSLFNNLSEIYSIRKQFHQENVKPEK